MSSVKVTRFTSDLTSELSKLAKPAIKTWQEKYMKNIIACHGVKVPGVRTLTTNLINKHQLESWPQGTIHDLTKGLLASRFAEEKLAGILVLASKSANLSDWQELLKVILTSFQSGHIFDWATCDQMCMGVLDKLIRCHGQPCADIIASWCKAEDSNIWTRRASAVSLVKLAPKCNLQNQWLAPIILEVCSVNVLSQERFLQTATGWLLRQYGVGHPKEMLNFVECNLRHFSREGLRYSLEKTNEQTAKRIQNKHKLLSVDTD